MKQTRLHLLLALGLSGLLGLIFLRAGLFESSADRAARQLSKHIQLAEDRIKNYAQTTEWDAFSREDNLWRATGQSPLSLEQNETGLLVWRRDSLVFWTDNRLDLSAPPIPETDSTQFQFFPTGYYALISAPMPQGRRAVFTQAIIRPSSWLGFQRPPADLYFEMQQGEAGVVDSRGRVIGFISSRTNHPANHWSLLWLGALLISGGVFLGRTVARVQDQWGNWPAIILLCLGILLPRWGLSTSGLLDKLPGFGPEAPMLWGIPLGQVAMDSLISFWLMLQFTRFFEEKDLSGLSARRRYWSTAMSYLPLFAGIFLIERLFRGIILTSSLRFDFSNVFSFSVPEMVTFLSVALLLIAFFIFTNRMLEHIVQLGLPRNQRLSTLSVSMLCAAPLALIIFPTWLESLQILLIALVYALLLDLFSETPIRTLTWLFIWLVFFAVFTSFLMSAYQRERIAREQRWLAQALTDIRDPDAETDLRKLAGSLGRHPIGNISRLTQILDSSLYFHPYLYQHYTYRLIPGITELREKDKPKNWQYLFRPNSESGYPFLLIGPGLDSLSSSVIGFRPRLSDQRFFPPLLSQDHPFKQLEHLADYQYLIYHQDSVYLRSGAPNLQWLYDTQLPIAQIGKVSLIQEKHPPWLDIMFQNPDGNLALMSYPLGGLAQSLSLGSFFFILLLGLCALLYLWNRLLWRDRSLFWLPLWGRPSLRNRIQLAVMVVMLGSFVLLGVVTLKYFKDSEQARSEQELGEKLNALQGLWTEDLPLLQPGKPLDEKLKQLEKRYGVPLQIYGPNGKLLAASEPQPFQLGVLPPRLPGPVFQKLHREPRSRLFQTETEPKAHQVLYGALINPDGSVAAFIGLRSGGTEKGRTFDYFHLLSTLMNVYVFLLLVAVVPAIYVANSITHPLSRIEEKLQATQLGENEPLEWKSSDEVGSLVAAYNAMIQTLAERTEKLKQQEREGAWREMAKQVAHEIKNPLTPMKLSIQYLLRAYQNNPEEMEPMLRRVSKTLIEQIDGLARIATEFSTFAKMPKPQNSHFELNSLVETVFQLFEQEESEHIRYTLELPAEPITVYADKEQIMRVLNNLIKNGAQAVPTDREGLLQIILKRKENIALVKISDNGTGIPDELQEKVFQPNFTTKSSGMGLGLAICRNIMDESGGRLYFTTEAGLGTHFFMELPLVLRAPNNY